MSYPFSFPTAVTAFAEQSLCRVLSLCIANTLNTNVFDVFLPLYPRKFSGNCPVSKILLIIASAFRVLKLKNTTVWVNCQWWVDLLLAKCIPPFKYSTRIKNINVFLTSHVFLPGLPILTISEHTGAKSTSINCHLSFFLLPNAGKGYVLKQTHLAVDDLCKTGLGLEGLQTKCAHS